MWYFRIFGTVLGMALLREMTAGQDEDSLVSLGERTQGWRYRDVSRCRTLWLESLLYGHLARSPRYPEIYLQFLAESAYAAAWASLAFWDADQRDKNKLEEVLSRTASFLDTLKPEDRRPGICDLKRRLERISGQGEARTEVWAYLVGHWVQTAAGIEPISAPQELADLGWPLASFGLGFWSQTTPTYRKQGELYRLAQPFELSDAFGLYGPFDKVVDSQGIPRGDRLVLASLVNTKGLRSPLVWELEGLFGGLPGVVLTRTGHVHRQFPGDDLPEWFEAVEITYESDDKYLKEILFNFWRFFHAKGDLVFHTTQSQRAPCLEAWREFVSGQPEWAVSQQLQLKLCNWFEPADKTHQKKALQRLTVLRETFQKLDLKTSYIATRVNAFASGFGQDEDVVLLAARYGFSDGLTLALRTIRYFGGWSR